MAGNGRRAIYSVDVVKGCDHDAIRSVIDSRDHQEAEKTLLVPDNPQRLSHTHTTGPYINYLQITNDLVNI